MAIFNSFTFDNENSLDSGIYITGEAVFNAPKRVVEMVNVPGRNGSIAIDEGRFENIPVKYPAGCFADNMADFAEKVANFRNILASRFTYKRLEDTYYPDEFRMGLYRSGLEVDVVNQARAGKFDIEFDCKPQRFLKSGEIPVEYTPGQTPSDEQTKTGSIVTFEAEEGTIISDIKADINPVQDLHGYDKPWAGGNGKNKLDYTNETDSSNEHIRKYHISLPIGTYTISAACYSSSDTDCAALFIYTDDTSSQASKSLKNGNWSSVTIDATKEVKEFRIYSSTNYANSQNYALSSINNLQVEEGSHATSYEPYANICPISGWSNVVVNRTGRNFLENGYTGPNTASGVTFTANSDGSISLSGTATSTFISICNFATGFFGSGAGQNDGKKHIPNGRWKVPYTGNNGVKIQVVGMNSPSGVSGIGMIFNNSQGTFTVDDTYQYNWVRLNILSGTVCDGITLYPMILREDDTSTAYEPYGNTYTIDLNGTRYGGTLDVTSGVLTVDRAVVIYNGSENWIDHTNSKKWYLGQTPAGWSWAKRESSICNIASYYDTSPSEVYAPYFCFGGSGIYFNKSSASQTLADFKSQLADTNAQVVYELATPITVQLTPTEVKALLGVNNVWADSGDITVKYGTNPYIIFNPTDFPSKPLLEVTGVGSFWLGDTQITITGTSGQIIYIDCETGECYKVTGGIISPANGLVTLNRLDFPKLASGINNIQLGSGISKVKITPRWWRL